MNKELIPRLYNSFEAETLCADAAEAIEELQAEVEMWKATSNAVIDMEKVQLRLERDTLRNTLARIEAKVDSTIAERDTLSQQLAEAQCDAERYRFLRDHFATKSENSVDDFITLEPMTGECGHLHGEKVSSCDCMENDANEYNEWTAAPKGAV